MSTSASLVQASLQKVHDEGMVVRRKVLGDAYVDASLSRATSDLALAGQFLATEAAWGTIWTRPGLELKQRSMIAVTMLATMGKVGELQAHVQGALRNGVTEAEITEIILQVSVYAGIPAGLEAFRAADAAIKSFVP